MSVMAKLVYLVSILPGVRRIRAAEEAATGESTVTDPFERTVSEFQAHIESSKTDSAAFSGKELYIYLHLIRSWFKYLSLKHQTDRETIQNMKENYIEYILCLKEMQVSRFMFVKAGADQYRERYAAAKKMKEEIEYAFANALGDEAAAALESVKALPHRCFNRHGDKAPEGYQFNKYETGVEKIAPDVRPALLLERASPAG